MHIDLNEVETGAPLRCRICIVGGGIAGLVLARQLARHGADTILLEGGGLELEERSQKLYQAEMSAERHSGSTEGRFRTLGGSSTRWGGQLLPYPPDIFRPVAGSPSTGWPIGDEELTPYYEAAQRMMHVDRLPFTEDLLPALGHPRVGFSPEVRLRYSKWMPFSKRNLAQTVGQACLAHPRLRLVTHANAISVEMSGGRVVAVFVADFRGRQFRVEAEQFVVACGTVESSRLLLNSPDVPNPHDQLGRGFHDHVSFHAAAASGAARSAIFERLGPFFVDGVLHTCKIETTSELQARTGLLAAMAHIVVQEPEDSGTAAVRNLLVSVQRGQWKEALTRNLLPMLRGAGDVARLLWASKVRKRRAVSRRAQVWLNIDMEQPAVSENRIRLSENPDALGMRKAVVDWRVGEAEYKTASLYARTIKKELEGAGFPALDWLPGLLEGERPAMADVFHPMGGLRMGVDPASSVVDPQLRVHGTQNLYVASCAVFPSGGSSNPTFTLIALTLRLADMLESSGI